MYAIIKTGGKQYRVQPGDLVVVEKLDGEPGAEVRLDQVLMLGDDKGVSVGAPTVDGAFASAVLVETRKGEKVKVFKKIRRQGYRQLESVLRVTGLSGDGKSAKWDGTVDLTTKAEMNARARGLAPRVEAEVEAKPTKVAKPAKAPVEAAPEAEAKTEAKKPAAKKKAAPKADKA